MTKYEDMPVRLAVPNDGIGLMHLLRMMHSEIGLFSFSERKVAEILNTVLHRKPTPTPMIIGVIGNSDDLQASICIAVSSIYYTEEFHIGDLWNFVRPDCRRSPHAKNLLEFGKACSDHMKLDLMSGVVSTERTEAKMRLYRRKFGPFVGGYFMHRHKLQMKEAS